MKYTDINYMTDVTSTCTKNGYKGKKMMSKEGHFDKCDCWFPGENGRRCEKVFRKELDLIDKEVVRDFVLECFDKLCPDYFWTAPASTTGKWHPKYALGKGGIVRHTKSAVWWGIELMKPFSIPEEYKSVIVAALILHDLRKNGDSLEEKAQKGYAITKTHGVDLAGEMLQDRSLAKYPIPEYRNLVFRAITAHMGVWTEPVGYAPAALIQKVEPHDPPTLDHIQSIGEKIALVVHLADFCASRKVDEMVKLIRK
jgi:hypothetical protein